MIIFKDRKILFVGGKIAMSRRCCCNTTPCCDHACGDGPDPESRTLVVDDFAFSASTCEDCGGGGCNTINVNGSYSLPKFETPLAGTLQTALSCGYGLDFTLEEADACVAEYYDEFGGRWVCEHFYDAENYRWCCEDHSEAMTLHAVFAVGCITLGGVKRYFRYRLIEGCLNAYTAGMSGCGYWFNDTQFECDTVSLDPYPCTGYSGSWSTYGEMPADRRYAMEAGTWSL